MHTTFTYHGGEKFTFRGDDDLWVFINRSLVMDLGGLHKQLSKTIELDTLGLNQGQKASFDLFFAERHTKESDFRVETTIHFDNTPVPETTSTTRTTTTLPTTSSEKKQ